VDERPELSTDLRVPGSLVSLVRGGATSSTRAAGHPDFADIVPADPPAGWGVRWHAAEDEAVDLETIGTAVEAASEPAVAIDEALADAPAPADAAPDRYWAGTATAFVWFGRESRFALDADRRAVTDTMPGHHRIKAGTEAASAAVDFVEAVCDGHAADADADAVDEAFPFDVVTRQFGPAVGDSVGIAHGKPDGRRLVLGRGAVTDRDPDGTVTIEREMSPGGTYDALGIERQAGDVAVTKVREGRWWYPTVYRSADGERRGTYVNVCTPVEVFPDAVRYVDLHVDVVKHADGTVERVDDDELDAAVAEGNVSAALAEKARSLATALESAL
jgi:Ribonuclease G/E